jgi:hypothetical protein
MKTYATTVEYRTGGQTYHVNIDATSPKDAARKYYRSCGSLGMLNYFRTLSRGHQYEVMGTSGIVLVITVNKFRPA